MYYKILGNKDFVINQYGLHAYGSGLNICPNGFQDYPYNGINLSSQGFYFTTIEAVPKFYSEGKFLWKVEIPDDTEVTEIIGNNTAGEYFAEKIILKEKYNLSEKETYDIFQLKYPELYICATHGYFDLIKYLVDVEKVVADKKSFKKAIGHGHFDIVEYFVTNGIDVSIADKYLELIADTGDFMMFKYLVENGARMDDIDNLFVCSLLRGSFDFIKYLVEHGANIHTKDDLALKESVNRGELMMVKYFVEMGADVNIDNGYCIRNACRANNLELVQFLVENGADVTANRNRAVASASWEGYLDIVKYLVTMGTDIHDKDERAVRCAVRNGHLDVVKYLVQLGANLWAKNNYVVKWVFVKNNLVMLKYLVEQGYKIKIDEKLLKIITINRDLGMVEYLFSLDDINLDINELLDWFVGFGYLDGVKYLVQVGVDVGVDAMASAITNHDEGMVNYLKSLGIEDQFDKKN